MKTCNMQNERISKTFKTSMTKKGSKKCPHIFGRKQIELNCERHNVWMPVKNNRVCSMCAQIDIEEHIKRYLDKCWIFILRNCMPT